MKEYVSRERRGEDKPLRFQRKYRQHKETVDNELAFGIVYSSWHCKHLLLVLVPCESRRCFQRLPPADTTRILTMAGGESRRNRFPLSSLSFLLWIDSCLYRPIRMVLIFPIFSSSRHRFFYIICREILVLRDFVINGQETIQVSVESLRSERLERYENKGMEYNVVIIL